MRTFAKTWLSVKLYSECCESFDCINMFMFFKSQYVCHLNVYLCNDTYYKTLLKHGTLELCISHHNFDNIYYMWNCVLFMAVNYTLILLKTLILYLNELARI